MNRLLKLFMCEYEIYLDPNYEYDCMQPPLRLIREIDPHNPDNVLKTFLHKVQQLKGDNLALVAMRKLTTMSLLILHSDKFYQTFADLLPLELDLTKPDQKWINQNFLQPYQYFLLKCCTSPEIYSKIKQNILPESYYTFETIFYIINILNKLFPSVQKISQLGRYFGSKGGSTPKMYSLMAAAQALKLYITLKTIILEMVNRSQEFLPTREDQKIMKTILGEYLVSINEEMKQLILNKYYAPYRQGIKTRLFRNQEQEQKTFKVINGILNSHRDTERENQRRVRQQTLLEYGNMMNRSMSSNSSFSFHPRLQEFSLNASSFGSQMSLMGSPLKASRRVPNVNGNCSQNVVIKKALIIEQQEFNQCSDDDDDDENENREQQKHSKSRGFYIETAGSSAHGFEVSKEDIQTAH